MRFGIGLSVQHLPDDPQAARFAEHVEQVRLARAVGFHSVWASQHYLSDPFTYFQPIPTLARVAADAGEMTLGTGILLLPLLQPVDVAEQLATLDVITGGRLIVGVGLGYRDVENHALQVDPRTRVSRFEEASRSWSVSGAASRSPTMASTSPCVTRASRCARCSGRGRPSGWRPTPTGAWSGRPAVPTPG